MHARKRFSAVLCLALAASAITVAPVSADPPSSVAADSQPAAVTANDTMQKSVIPASTPTQKAIVAPDDTTQKPVVTAEETEYDADTGRYHLSGNVTVTNGDRVTRMDDAQVSATNFEIWGEGSVSLDKGGEAFFTADAVYLEGFAPSTMLFGRVRFERPGLAIRAESATCDWSASTATFHGHVVCIENGKETVAGTLVFDFESGSARQYS